MNVTIKVFASNVYLKQNHHTPSHGNAPLEKSMEDKEFNEFIITLKNYGNCFTQRVTVRNRYYNSKSWTALRDSKGQLQCPLACPVSCWISPFQRCPHRSFLTLSPPSCPLHTTWTDSPPPVALSGGAPRAHSPALSHGEITHWTTIPISFRLERPPPGSSLNWNPPGTAFSSCCTLTHRSLFWGASPFLMGFKFFGGKDSIKIIFTDLLFCTSKKFI